jgi:iron complex outermembrane recepter protein
MLRVDRCQCFRSGGSGGSRASTLLDVAQNTRIRDAEPCLAQCAKSGRATLLKGDNTLERTSQVRDRHPDAYQCDAGSRHPRRMNALLAVFVALPVLRVMTAMAQSAPQGATGSADAVLQEVVVTATRRAENLNRVPESVIVFNASSIDLQGIRTAAELAERAPGVDLTTQLGIQTNIAIRGISNSAGQQTTGPATTGIYLDDTPVQIRSIGNGPGNPLPDIFDLDRVEVLRGPQGTLFGSGSEGGAIRFISVEPSLDTKSGYRRGELGFTDHGGVSYDVGAAQGGPIINGVLGFRISAHYQHEGGFINMTPFPDGAGPDPTEANANYANTTSARAALVWVPFDGLKITPSVYFRETDTHNATVAWLALSDFSSQRYVSGNGQNSPDTNNSSLASVNIDWTRGSIELISNTSYYDRQESNLTDYRALITNTFGPVFWQMPGSPYLGQSSQQILSTIFTTPGYYDNGLINNTQSNWTQEIRIQSTNPTARLTWVGGIFYADNRQLNYQNNRTPFLDVETGIPAALIPQVFGYPLIDGQYIYVEQIITHDKQLAGYGEVNFNLTSHLKLTAGLRVARTEVDYADTRDGALAGGPGEASGKTFETPKTPKYGLTYQFNSNNMVYGSVSEGFRVGGVNPQIDNAPQCAAALAALGYSAEPLTYNSDRVRSYEIGAKIQPVERFRVAASVYYIDWFNIIQPVDLTAAGCTSAFTANLGTAVSKGADLEATFAATQNLLLNLNLNYDDAKYTETIRNPGAPFNLVTSGWTLGQTPWTVVASAKYKFRMPFGWNSYFRADVDFRSKNNGLTAVTDPAAAAYNPFLQPSPSTVDLRLRYGVQVSSWDVSLYVNNATNDHPILNRQNDAVGGAIQYATPVQPITAGITVLSRF